jgi:hypothetical protein
MGYMDFTDSAGNAQVTNGLTLEGRRFANWVPDVVRVADRRTVLGTGKFYEYIYRQDYVARFQIEHLTAADMAVVMRWKSHAMKGCDFVVDTEDSGGRVYTCRLRPDTEPTIELVDRTTIEYTLSVEVMSADEPAVPLECLYSTGA